MEKVANEPIVPVEAVELIWQGVDHPEGLAIDEDGTVWCGGEEGQVYRGLADAEPAQIATLPGRTLGFALDAAGNAYCADMTGPGIYRVTPTGEVHRVSQGTADRPAQVPNYLAFLPSGELLFTDSGTWGGDDGRIYAVEANGETRVIDTSACKYPNGIAVTPEGTALVVVESTLPGVTLLDVGDGARLSNRRVLVEMPDTVPDGVAYDEAGRLLISCWVPDAIFLLEKNGELRVLSEDPLRLVLNQPTNVAFVPGTARVLASNIGERFLSVLEHDTKGADLSRPAFNWRPQDV